VGLAILASLGTWQYGRYQEKLGLEAELAARADLPPKTASTLDAIDLDADRNRVLTLQGTITRGEGVVFKHRTLEGRPGVWFAAPLELEDGSRVVANLGWLPVRDNARWVAEERAKAPETGSFTGLLHVLDQNIEDARMRARLAKGEVDPGEDVLEWSSYDVEALTALYGVVDDRPPMVFVLTDAHSGDPFPRASTDYVTKPYMTSDRHLGYSAFWYTTGAALLLIYLGASFGLIGSRRRQPRGRPESLESSEEDSLA
jgi:cytochrome oxidase assembly protein ShyY1